MKRLFKMMKPMDFVLILVALVLSFVPPTITYFNYRDVKNATVASKQEESKKESIASDDKAESTDQSQADTSGESGQEDTSQPTEEKRSGVYAIVRIRGEVVDEFELVEGGDHFLTTYYPEPGKYNIVEVDGDRIRVKEDNSPDQIAVMTSWISRPGSLSICLPHALVIEIRGYSQEVEDPVILPHQ